MSAYGAWRRGHRLLVGAYLVTAFHVAIWLWENDWKPIAFIALLHVWGWFTMLIGVWATEPRGEEVSH